MREYSDQDFDKVIIRGWFVKNSKLRAAPCHLFRSNAEEVSYLVHEAEKFGGWSLALINYRATD